jgi:hypothetical protein
MKQILVIDDERTFIDDTNLNVTYARTYQEGYEQLWSGREWDEVWLDHDLADPNPYLTGYALAKIIEERPIIANAKCFVIHTSNPVGRANMKAALRAFPVRFVRAEDFMRVR